MSWVYVAPRLTFQVVEGFYDAEENHAQGSITICRGDLLFCKSGPQVVDLRSQQYLNW